MWVVLEGNFLGFGDFGVLGPIGLVTMMVARAFGASRIVIADVSPDRLRFAKGLVEGSEVESVQLSFKDEVQRGLKMKYWICMNERKIRNTIFFTLFFLFLRERIL